MSKSKYAYFYPQIKFSTKLDSGSLVANNTHETCRENVIASLWGNIRRSKDEPIARGKHPATLGFSFSVPKSKEGWSKHESLTPEDHLVKRLLDLETSKDAREQLHSMVDIVSAIPLMLFSGPKAYRPSKGAYKFDDKKEAYWDWSAHPGKAGSRSRLKIDYSYSNLTNCLIQHPAVMSLVIGQIRWALEEYSLGGYAKFNKELNITRTRDRLLEMSKKKSLSPADVRYLKVKFEGLVSLSKTPLVERSLERYPINRFFSKHTLDLLTLDKDCSKIKSTWSKAVLSADDSIYGDYVGQYGYYKWVAREHVGEKEVTKLLNKVNSQHNAGPNAAELYG
jgi:hypothetical protein